MTDNNLLVSRLREEFKSLSKLAVIGIGSEARSDDSLGLYITNKLKEKINDPRIEFLIGGTTPENLTDVLRKLSPSHVLLIDAARADRPPGTVTIVDPRNLTDVKFSSHPFSMSELVDYINRSIGARTVILGIEPENVIMGEGISPVVLKAADETVKMLLSLLT